MLQLLLDKKVEITDETKDTQLNTEDAKSFKTLFSLLKLVKSRLQYVLKTLVKTCMTKAMPGKESSKLADKFKACYKVSFCLTDELDCDSLLKALHNSLLEIRNILKDIKGS